MTQEDKELLLKDICARLPYGVIVSLHDSKRKLTGVLDAVYPTDDRVIVDNLSEAIAPINVRCGGFLLERDNVKPYLRPMSSMTKEEREILRNIYDFLAIFPERNEVSGGYQTFDYLNSIHIDYRGLIPRGLALEESKGMYK